jgi:hypothetical protein
MMSIIRDLATQLAMLTFGVSAFGLTMLVLFSLWVYLRDGLDALRDEWLGEEIGERLEYRQRRGPRHVVTKADLRERRHD